MKLEIDDKTTAFALSQLLLPIVDEWTREFEKRQRLLQWSIDENDETYLPEPIQEFAVVMAHLTVAISDTQDFVIELLEKAAKERMMKLATLLAVGSVIAGS